jgi:hypothetical protein
MDTSIPSDWALNLADELGDYIFAVFHELILPDDCLEPPTIPSMSMPINIISECEHAAKILAEAFLN